MSAVPTAQAALVALLEASQGAGEPFEGVFVRFGAPRTLPKQNDRVYVLENVPSHSRSRPSAFAEDDFELQLLVEVWRTGADSSVPNARTWELIDAVDALLAQEDFYGYQTEDGELQSSVTPTAYDDGNLFKATVTISLISRD